MEKEKINKLKEKFEDEELSEIEESFKERLKKNYQISSRDYFALANFFIESYKFLEEDFEKEKDVKDILDKLKDIKIIRDLFDSYGDGTNYGSHWVRDKIKDYVKDNEKVVKEISSLFYKLYLEEE